MKILIDMNLSPKLTSLLENAGFNAIHWSKVGKPNATDKEIFFWAKTNGYIILTHDLDFGSILASTNADFPSVIQIRTLDIRPQKIFPKILLVLNKYDKYLKSGALIVLEEHSARIKILPLKKENILGGQYEEKNDL
ncbi:DUF5615 family PIN-like protein [Thermodesulfatator atlanticus]|uniref:DUF5615 family PIN-like protein n=1 Tax=Thermodesulfatator atlanticus TaxID=501497 RepID=UPI0003B696A3|nr:DUF5615 family PIN-like protein [Thermodesulfatator atlanticus]